MGYSNHALISLIIMVLTPLIKGDDPPSTSLVVAKHCTSKCGNVNIPYPFGIEDGCYYEDKDNPDSYPIMSVKCNQSMNPPNLILGKNIKILDISIQEAEIRLDTDTSYDCYSPSGNPSGKHSSSSNLVSFTVSSSKNKFVATGCDTYAWFTGERYGKAYYTGCMTQCEQLDDVVDSKCNGVGCCEASIPDGVTNITTKAYSFDNHTSVRFNPCSVAYAVAADTFKFSQQNLTLDLSYVDLPTVPVIFNWGIGTKSCSEAIEEGSCLCKKNTICSDLKPDQDGYRCGCMPGYSGNPYLPQGSKCPLWLYPRFPSNADCWAMIKR